MVLYLLTASLIRCHTPPPQPAADCYDGEDEQGGLPVRSDKADTQQDPDTQYDRVLFGE
jgi:hypothetical protein